MVLHKVNADYENCNMTMKMVSLKYLELLPFNHILFHFLTVFDLWFLSTCVHYYKTITENKDKIPSTGDCRIIIICQENTMTPKRKATNQIDDTVQNDNHIPVLSSFMTYHRVYNNSNTTNDIYRKLGMPHQIVM